MQNCTTQTQERKKHLWRKAFPHAVVDNDYTSDRKAEEMK